MNVRIETATDWEPPRVTVTFVGEYGDKIVSVTGTSLAEALAQAINRFGEMQQEAIAELQRLGLLSGELTRKPKEEAS